MLYDKGIEPRVQTLLLAGHTGRVGHVGVAFNCGGTAHGASNLVQATGILGTLKPGVVALIRLVCILEWIRGIASFARME